MKSELKMKRFRLWLIALLPVTAILLSFCVSISKGEKKLTSIILEALEQLHYQPAEINDTYSEKVFTLYLKRLDNSKRFFTQKDIESLTKFKHEIDDQAKADKLDFLNATNAIFAKRVEGIEKMYKEILAKPFDFKVDENYEFDEDNLAYPKSQNEQKELWRKYLKWSVLDRLYKKLNLQEKAMQNKDSSIKILPFDTLEYKSRMEVLKSQNEWFARLKKFDSEDKLALYTNCITEVFDPHTNYFPPKDKEDFDIRISGRLIGIGAQLSEREGYIKVESIVPGSPAFKQGELKVGDLILKVAQGSAEPVDVVDMKLSDAVQLIRGEKGKEVRLTVKKPDGSIKIISIIRDEVIMEEGYAKSAIIDYEGKKYGYINLPQFYTNLNERSGRTCSVDVEKEVEKLKNEKVEGIIMDLRNNGGGSLQDVVDMSGLFIEKGPIVQIKSRGKSPEILPDRDERIQYNGPLVIMVNSYSASASEIMAAALQDYERAVVIGTSNATFGKGTVQRFVDMDRVFQDPNYKIGSIKLTIQKFYRINGNTTQLKGVIPDIVVPERWSHFEIGEKKEEYPLGVDLIPSASYSNISCNYREQIKLAVANSQKRISESQIFNTIKSQSETIHNFNKKTVFTLNLEKYKSEQAALDAENKKYDAFTKTIPEININALYNDIKSAGNDSMSIKIKTDWLKPFKKDVYLDEAVRVLIDLKK